MQVRKDRAAEEDARRAKTYAAISRAAGANRGCRDQQGAGHSHRDEQPTPLTVDEQPTPLTVDAQPADTSYAEIKSKTVEVQQIAKAAAEASITRAAEAEAERIACAEEQFLKAAEAAREDLEAAQAAAEQALMAAKVATEVADVMDQEVLQASEALRTVSEATKVNESTLLRLSA